VICIAGTPCARMRAASLSVSRSPSMTAMRYRSAERHDRRLQQGGLAGARRGHEVDREHAVFIEVLAVVRRHPVVGGEQILQHLDHRAGGPLVSYADEHFRGSCCSRRFGTSSIFSSGESLSRRGWLAPARRSSTRRSRSSSPATTRVRKNPPQTPHTKRFGAGCDCAPQLRQRIVTAVDSIDSTACAAQLPARANRKCTGEQRRLDA
jgi:hypothetical protein